MIETQNLSKRYGRIQAVDDVSFRSSPAGARLLGPNGAGKSTTMKMIAGFLTQLGSAKVCGFDVREQSIQARRELGYLSEGAPSYGEMTVWGFSTSSPMRGLQARSGASGSTMRLAGCTGRRADAGDRHPVQGFRRRVGLAQAILHDPRVLS